MPGFQVTHRGGLPHPTLPGAPHIHLKFLRTGARLPQPRGGWLCPGSPAYVAPGLHLPSAGSCASPLINQGLGHRCRVYAI